MSFLSKYQIGETILEGETRTSNARELSSGRDLLVHELPSGADRTRGTDLLRMIHRYLRSLSPKARNPILELGEHEGRMYLVTETIPGFQSLRSWLEGSFAADAPQEDSFDKSRLSLAPPPISSVPSDPTSARTQVIQVAPGEWVLTSALPSPTSGPADTRAADITGIEPAPAVRSPADLPYQPRESVGAVREGSGRAHGPESRQSRWDDVTAVGLPPANSLVGPSNVTVQTPVGSATGYVSEATATLPTTGTSMFEATEMMPSAGGRDVGGGDPEQRRAPAAEEMPPRTSAGLDQEWSGSLPPPPAAGEFTMVLGSSQDSAAWERKTQPAPLGSSGGPATGEFTKLMQAAPAATASGVPPDSPQGGTGAQTGDFTRMFGGVCAPGRPGDRSQDLTPHAFNDESRSGGFSSGTQTRPAIWPTTSPSSSELPEGLAERPAGEFTRIFGTQSTPGPLSFGQGPATEGYTNRPGPGEFTQIFGREGQTAHAGGELPGPPEPAFPPGGPHFQNSGSAPAPSVQKADAAPFGAPKAAPEIKLPEIPAAGKSASAPPAPPKLAQPPAALAGKLPKAPPLTAPPKPPVPAVPKPPPLPKAPVASPKLKVPAAAKIGKQRKSSLPLILILGTLLVVATALILYFALAGH